MIKHSCAAARMLLVGPDLSGRFSC